MPGGRLSTTFTVVLPVAALLVGSVAVIVTVIGGSAVASASGVTVKVAKRWPARMVTVDGIVTSVLVMPPTVWARWIVKVVGAGELRVTIPMAGLAPAA